MTQSSNDEVIEAAESCKPLAIAIAVPKTMFLPQMPEKGVIRTYLSIPFQHFHQDHNATVWKSLLACIELHIESLLLLIRNTALLS